MTNPTLRSHADPLSTNPGPDQIQEARELALARLHDMGWLVTHVATQVEADAARERFVELLEDSVLKHAAARD